MMYLGDILEDATIHCWWTSNGADGASITRATNGTISIYKNADNTQSTAGVTDTEDADSVTGCHRIVIDTSADAFYEAGKDYAIVLSAATIDGKTVNAVLGMFSIENRNTKADLRAIGGGAQSATDLKDFADDGYDPSTNKLTGLLLADAVTVVNGLAANTITATSIAADAITAAKIADGAIDAATFAANAITATAIAADAITDAKVASDVTIASVTGAVGSVTGAVGSVTGAVGSVTGNVGGNVTGTVGSLAAQAKADVNAEVLDVLNVDTFAEPGQGAPAATTTLAAKINYLYKAWRNKKTQTATDFKLYADDASTVDQKATHSDDATTYTSGEIGTGP